MLRWDVLVKRFYMYGDAEMSGSPPFMAVSGKVEKVQSLVQKLVQATQNKVNGIELFEATLVQDLIELLRKCSKPELQQIQDKLMGQQQNQQGSQRNGAENKNAEILADLLAAAGTRNTIEALTQIILHQKLTPAKAAQSLKSLSGLPAPSVPQVGPDFKIDSIAYFY